MSPLTRRQRLAVAVWDNLPLRVQHVVFDLAPRLARHLDELGARHDENRLRGLR